MTDDSGLHIVAVQEGGNLLSGGGVTREVVRVIGTEDRPVYGTTHSQRFYILLVREHRAEDQWRAA